MDAPPAPIRTLGPLGQLRRGDRLYVEGSPVEVAGWIAYDGEWVEYLLSDTTWLCVELVDGNHEFSRWWERSDAPPPAASTIEVDGHPYRELESYKASWVASGIGGLGSSGTVWAADYASTVDPAFLAALEDWGGGPELSVGRKVSPGDVAPR